MGFQKKFHEEMFVRALSNEIARTAAKVAQLVGCEEITANRIMPTLEARGVAKRVVIEIPNNKTITGWLKV